MTVYLYPGYCPSNVSKDAKYSIKHGGDGGWAVHLIYTVNNRERELLTTNAHPTLVEMVNAAKREITGLEGGAFYINEYAHVVVPTSEGHLYAGYYPKELRFEFEGSTIGPAAPDGLQPGEDWPGPHPGVAYTLAAGGADVYFEKKKSPTRISKQMLSDEIGKRAAGALARRLSQVKGNEGGRVYINERCEFFAPVKAAGGWRFLYLGHLEDDAWFPGPDMDD